MYIFGQADDSLRIRYASIVKEENNKRKQSEDRTRKLAALLQITYVHLRTSMCICLCVCVCAKYLLCADMHSAVNR